MGCNFRLNIGKFFVTTCCPAAETEEIIIMKETVMQFGEGGFLRGFVDYFFKKLNDAGVYEGKVVE